MVKGEKVDGKGKGKLGKDGRMKGERDRKTNEEESEG